MSFQGCYDEVLRKKKRNKRGKLVVSFVALVFE